MGTVIACLLYGGIAVGAGADEVIPLFRWNLFSTVPAPVHTDYSIRLLGRGGARPGQYYEETGLSSGGREAQAYEAMQTLGSATERNLASASERRRAFASTYLSGLAPGRYQIVRRTYDLKDRITCECFESERVLGEYQIP